MEQFFTLHCSPWGDEPSSLCSVGVAMYLFLPAVCRNSSRGWGSAKPLLKQSTPSATLEERCDLCSGFVSALTKDIKRKWMVLQDISTSFQTETYGTTMSRDLPDVLSHPNRAGLRQIKCPCESCKMPLDYDAPSKQIPCFRCYRIAYVMLNSSLKIYIYIYTLLYQLKTDNLLPVAI